ncbi:dTDP-4-dehydrorhamnose 3,5-epimerase family protein [Rhizobium sp. C1]|uniref:dTDP-4-dehydrorhamnose 3,5-epimerase family protein n=1 Tax=Rhizobium sp. C1 TaxID=1349799 RepID=UPI001E412845|nr:dTDP-4-dehydrorhamnose 3,5-epimerase family protein [Rhizobium sp. C1]MCD2178872.1 dTDP-4-dehydrorhamnose 3,5-epimerase family protein [Rhizobium sp. C1]
MPGNRFLIEPTFIAGVCTVTRRRLADERGFLSRLFEPEELAHAGWRGPIAQINETGTKCAGTVRGLHFQRPPHAEMKLVSCIAGRILDVAVDLRKGSPTYLQSVALELSAENGRALLIPEGCAHGFQALTHDVRMIYLHTAPYAATHEGGFDALDPVLGLNWPLPVVNRSARDEALPRVASGFEGLGS